MSDQPIPTRIAIRRALVSVYDKTGLDDLVRGLHDAGVELVSADFLEQFVTLNTHPALCPAFPGMHGPRDALEHGVKVTGATLFVVDAGVDTGPIVAQVPVAVSEDDDVDSLHERIKTAERAMLVESVGRIAREGLTVDGRRVRIGAPAR